MPAPRSARGLRIATGRRVLTPADDPVAASQMLDVSEAKEVNKQHAENAATVKARLSQQEVALSAIARLIQDVQTRVVQAGDGALSSTDLRSIAEEIEGRYQELLGLANSSDGSGEYLFAGFRTNTQPFAETAPGVVAYFGDEGSGGWIGRKALSVVTAASDGREPETSLTGAILTAAEVNEVWELVAWAAAASPSRVR